MAKEEKKLVKAIVVRGSYHRVLPDGNREIVLPGKGKDSEVEVTESQLEAFEGVLARPEVAQAEQHKAASESMAPSTPPAEATGDAPSSRRR